MRSPLLPTWRKIAGVGVPLSGGSLLISLAGVPRTTAIVVAGALLAVTAVASAIAVALPPIVESIQKRKANNLKAKCEVIEARSEARLARSEARALERRTRAENKITKMGMKSSEKAELAERMIQIRALSPDRPEGRRLPDDVLDRHLGAAKNRTTTKKPRTPPRGSSGGGQVLELRPPTDDLTACRSREVS